MTKREKFMLVMLAFVAVAALGITALILPLLNLCQTNMERVSELRTRQAEMQQLLGNTSLEERLLEQQKLAAENSAQFYSVLNTYTIGEVLNKLAQDNFLSIRELHIADYVPLAQNAMASKEEAAASTLVKAPAQMVVTGSYEDILHFLDALHAKSYSLNVSALQLQKSTGKEALMQGSFQIDIFGISVGDSALNLEEIIQK